ncbi:MAG TPA: sigma-70 family RNA polymerase sigma factor [Arthrobacter sp.]|nr:sigma-70 family RNA polymerase sigma factor [Arthrobacter sp.]
MPETPPSYSVTGPPRTASQQGPPTGRLHDAFENQLVLNYLDLAESLASRYAARGRERSDLVQVAYLGLVKAARGFDQEKGESFPAYAAPTISGELKRFLRDRCWTVRPPRRIQDVRTQMLHTAPDMAQSLGRVPSEQELAAELGVTAADVREAQAAASSMHPDSLDSPDPWGGPSMGEALVSPDQPIEHLEELVCLNQAIQELEPDDREMLYRRYFREETQVELGKRFGISQMQVSRRLSRILVWLQRRLLDEEGRSGDTGTGSTSSIR